MPETPGDARGQRRSFPELVWTSEMVERFWNWQSQYPEQYFTYQFGGAIARNLSRWLTDRDRVADYGCGTGFFIPHLARLARHVVGLDLSPESVRVTNDLHGHLEAFEGAFLIDEVLGRDTRYDAVTVIEVVEHLYDPELEVVLANVRHLLSNDGVAIFTTPNDERLEASQVICPVTGHVFHRYQHVRKWTAVTLSERLRLAGFDVVAAFSTDLGDDGWRKPLRFARKIVRYVRGGGSQQPHLVCVARAANE